MSASKKALSATMTRAQEQDGTSQNGASSGAMLTRTTIMYPVALDENLEVYAIRVGRNKGEIIKQVLSDFLRSQGLQPDKRPKRIDVSY